MYPGGKDHTEFDGIEELRLKSQKNVFKANDLFFSNSHIYKSEDYHCLKQYSHKNNKKWRKYDMAKYREAYNEKMLKSVRTFKYDNMLYNFVDPKVFKAFTENEKNGRKMWKKIYGFHYTRQLPGYNDFVNLYACYKKCIKMENSKFARRCKEDGGYFKCCIAPWRLYPFEESRNKLIQNGWIKSKESNICNQTLHKINPGLYCLLDGICTKHNPMTGEVVQLLYPKKTPIPMGKMNIFQLYKALSI